MDLSLWDKASGMDKLAPAKYMKLVPAITVFGENKKSGEFIIRSFSNTFVRNYDGCPETEEKDGPLMQEIWQRGGVLYTLLDQVDKETITGETDSGKVIVPAEWEALGEFGEQAYRVAKEMKAVFQVGVVTYEGVKGIMGVQLKKRVGEVISNRGGSTEMTSAKSSVIEGLERIKEDYAKLYGRLAEAIDRIPIELLPKIGDQGLGDEVQGVLDDLVKLWRVPASKL